MTEQPRSRKRRHSGYRPSPNNSLHQSAKRQKLGHLARRPEFWDSLSEVPLVKGALDELDRRNAEHGVGWPRSSINGSRRPFTCNFFTATLESLATAGGPDLSDLRGYKNPEREMSASRFSLGRRKRSSTSASKNQSTSNTTATKNTGPYDRAFLQHLIDFGIYPHEHEFPDGRVPPPPDNMDEIKQALAQRRLSLSPSRFSEAEFKKFKRADAAAHKERQVTTSVIPLIQGQIADSRCVAGEIPFTNLNPLTDGTIIPGNPDVYYGARPEQLDRRVRAELSRYIVPSTQHDLPIAPNFFVAVKGPDGSAAVAKRQVLNDVTLGARGQQSLRSYRAQQLIYDNKAYTIGCTYHDGQLKMYTSHPVPPRSPGGRPEYVMTQIKAYAMTSDSDAYRQGAAAYRNGNDWAKEQRNEAIKQANKTATSFATDTSIDDAIDHTSQDTLTPAGRSNAPLFYDSETSADELAPEAVNPPKRHRKRATQPRRRQSTEENPDPAHALFPDRADRRVAF